jgi:hypothetical protein
MRALLTAGVILLAASLPLDAGQIDYAALWANATPFHTFLENVRARQEQWRSRFSNAAVDAAALTSARALPAKRRILAVAEGRCSDSAWAVPYLAKLAAAVPEKLELRVIGRVEGSRVQSDHLTPDGRRATPTIVVLDDKDAFIGAWVERPAELQKWFLENKPKVSADELHEHMEEWYTNDAGKSTVNEVLAILNQVPAR